MAICGVESLVYGVEDLERCARFFEDWGLQPAVGRGDWSLPDGTTIRLRAIGDRSLPPALVPGSTVRETVWGVDSRESLQAIGAELSRDREVTETSGTLHTVDQAGYAIAFRITGRKPLKADLPHVNSLRDIGRKDERARAALPYRVHPQRIVHLVSWVPRDIDAAMRFYVERLGFRLTESVDTSGHFLRCAAESDHHNLFLNCRGDNFGFQHVAFEVRDVDEVMMCGQYMERRGWKSHLGPGRHTVGSNVYWYFWCPAGGLAEVGCDIDYITDHWPPQRHAFMPAGGSAWFARPEDEGLRPGHGEWPQWQPAKSVQS